MVENAHESWSIADLQVKKQEAELNMRMLAPLPTQSSRA
jgi:hypothetical protein